MINEEAYKPRGRTNWRQSSAFWGARWILLHAQALFVTAVALFGWLPQPHSVHAFQSGTILPLRRFQYPQQKYQQQKYEFVTRELIDLPFHLLATTKTDPQDHDDVNEETPFTVKSAGNTPISHLANDANLSSWTVNNPTWDQNIAALLQYNATYGTVNLPSLSKEYPNLGLWVHNLRNMKGRLTKEQIQQLEDIGFLWKESFKDKNDQKWYEMFTRLQAYKDKYGDCLVTVNFKPDPQLGRWVMTQRKLYRDEMLREDRKALLDSIDFVWRLVPFRERDRPDLEELWEQRYQELIEFKEEHNHTNVPQIYPPNKELAYWVHAQRERKKDGTLREDRIPRLDKIGFIWEFEPIRDESWLEQYEEVKTYYQELATYKEMMENSPEGSVAATRPVCGARLTRWMNSQNRLHAKGDICPKRKAMLDDIGFDWY